MWQTVVRRRILLYFGCLYRRSTSTRRDFCILSLATVPISFLRMTQFPGLSSPADRPAAAMVKGLISLFVG
jgi:hypothetical protein